MKFLTILFLILMFSCKPTTNHPVVSNNVNEVFIIENIKSLYSISDTIKLNFLNRTGDSLHFYISWEGFDKLNKWREFEVNEVGVPLKAALIHSLKQNEKQNIEFDLKTLLKDLPSTYDSIRLKINYNIDITKIDKLLYTKGFIIMNNN